MTEEERVWVARRYNLRQRLIAMRKDLLEQLMAADHLDAGWLTMLSGVHVALQAMDGDDDDGADEL